MKTPLGGVGVNDEIAFANFIEEQIIDINLDPCSKGILDKLKNLKTNDIAKVLDRFGSPKSKYFWEIKSGTPINPNNVAETDWVRDSSGKAVDKKYITKIDSTYQGKATQLSIARTILHELLHTYLISLVDDTLLTGSTDITDFPLLWNTLVKQTYDNNPNRLQHEIIGRKFIEPLRDALKEWDGSSKSDQFYEDLAWGNLQNTSTFNSIFPIGSTERDRILDRNLSEDTNTTVNNITPKGKPCK